MNSFFTIKSIKLHIIFSATDSVLGRELFVSDGTITELFLDIFPEEKSSNPTDFIEYTKELYFVASDNIVEREIRKINTTTLSVATVGDITQEEKLRIYPNPTSAYFSINTTSQINIQKVELYDQTGKFIQELSEVQKKYTIKHLAAGIYFVKIYTSCNSKTKKLIVR